MRPVPIPLVRILFVLTGLALTACRRAPEELPPPSTVESAVSPKAVPLPAPVESASGASAGSVRSAPLASAGPAGAVPGCPPDPDPKTVPVTRPIDFPEAKIRVEAEVARTEHEVTRGLMYRTTMSENSGMLFRMPRREEQIFWMRKDRKSVV